MTTLALSPATYHTPTGWAQLCALRDDGAAHQIRIQGIDRLRVSCTCQRTGYHGAGIDHCLPIASIATADQAWKAWRIFHEEGKS